LNDEVRGVATIRATRAIEKGEHIRQADLADLQQFELEDDDLDCGHFTAMNTGGAWIATFNFLYGRPRALKLIERAAEFLESAKSAFDKGHAAVAVDNLFSACELASKAELLVRQLVAEKSNHRHLHRAVNWWGRLGNIDAAFVDLFNKLAALRPRYRYDAEYTDPMPVDSADLELVEVLIDATKRRLQPKVRLREEANAPGYARQRNRL
jgi:uncharacterized protein (UPF0332 family)